LFVEDAGLKGGALKTALTINYNGAVGDEAGH